MYCSAEIISRSRKSRCRDERGFALILTMVMLAVLSVLGIMVLNTTDTELNITTNSRINSDAFVAANLTTEYAQHKVINEADSLETVTTLFNDQGQLEADLAAVLPSGVDLVVTGRNEINFYTGAPPAGISRWTSTDVDQDNIYVTSGESGSGVAEGSAAYYRVSVEAKARGKSSSRLETLFVNRGGQVF